MKLSKKVGLIIVSVVIVTALASLFSIYAGQASERGELQDRLSRTESLLPTLMKQKKDQQDQLADATSALDANKAEFPEVVESIEYGEDFFKIADDCNVDITRLNSSPPTGKNVGSIIYFVSSFVVVVEGDTDNILKFIDAIGTGIDYDLSWSFQLPWSVDVKSVDMEVNKSKATISLDIYGYEGA